MTRFAKENFHYFGGYLTYVIPEGNKYFKAQERYSGAFVARFKYVKASKASFQSFLIKNFTVEEYFERMEKKESPLDVLQSRGYLQPHIKKLLKQSGYAPTTLGYSQYLKSLSQNNVHLAA